MLVAGVALSAVVLLVGLLTARLGTPAARVGALATFVALLAIVAWARAHRARRNRDPRSIILRAIGPVDHDAARRTVRAYELAQRRRRDDAGTSPELARLHLLRLLTRAPLDQIAERAAIRARWLAGTGLAFGLAAVALVALQPLRIVEGLDVTLAADGVAPIRIQYLDDVELSTTAPSYLRPRGLLEPPPRKPSQPQPRGTILTVRGQPTHAARSVVLTDGTTTVPFVADGQGGLVAHWTIQRTSVVRIGARFGEVLILQDDDIAITSIADRVPVVKLEGAPRTARTVDEHRIELRYRASDDHGLREVALVMRAGGREERQLLTGPNAAAATATGGVQLDRREPFIDESPVPVEVTIEALDNDAVSGPKWGRSEAVTVVPVQIGQAEAKRHAALLRARDALSDLTTTRQRMDPPRRTAAAHADAELVAQLQALRVLDEVLDEEFGDLRVGGAMEMLALGQRRRLQTALSDEGPRPTPLAHEALVDVTEQVMLALQAGAAVLAHADAKAIARRLSSVATEVADAERLLADDTDAAAGQRRFAVATQLLGPGGLHVSTLGTRGADVGEMVQVGLRRIVRAHDAGDHQHAEDVARHLAARLADAGQERGGDGHAAPAEAGCSQADDEIAEARRALRELIHDHREVLYEVSRVLEEATRPEDLERPLLHRASTEESNLTDRAKELARRGESGDATMPWRVTVLLHLAAGTMDMGTLELRAEDGIAALHLLNDAQRLLEMALGPECTSGNCASGQCESDRGKLCKEGSSGSEKRRRECSSGTCKSGECTSDECRGREGDAERAPHSQDTKVPGPSDRGAPRAFRERVMDGLRDNDDPRLSEAVKRYAEDLLR